MTAVRRIHDPGSPVDGGTEIVAVALVGDAGVQSAADLERDADGGADRKHFALERYRRAHRGDRIAEDGVESVARRLDHAAAVRFDAFPRHPVVTVEGVGHAPRFGLPESRAAFDVGEEERDRSGRRVGHRDVRGASCGASIAIPSTTASSNGTSGAADGSFWPTMPAFCHFDDCAAASCGTPAAAHLPS